MPILAVAAVGLAVRSSWRHRFAKQFAGACFVLLIATLLAAQSGEALVPAVRDSVATDKHQELAGMTRNFIGLLFLASLALGWSTRNRERVAALIEKGAGERAVSKVAVISSGLSLLFAALGTIWMIRTGHEGARIVWDGVLKTKK